MLNLCLGSILCHWITFEKHVQQLGMHQFYLFFPDIDSNTSTQGIYWYQVPIRYKCSLFHRSKGILHLLFCLRLCLQLFLYLKQKVRQEVHFSFWSYICNRKAPVRYLILWIMCCEPRILWLFKARGKQFSHFMWWDSLSSPFFLSVCRCVWCLWNASAGIWCGMSFPSPLLG